MSSRWLGFGAAALALALVGCASRFTRERFDMIREGMDGKQDVRELIGKPEFDAGDEWYYENEKKHYAARIFFDESDRVRAKEWIDARSGTWEGRHPDADEPPAGEVRERRIRARRIDDD